MRQPSMLLACAALAPLLLRASLASPVVVTTQPCAAGFAGERWALGASGTLISASSGGCLSPVPGAPAPAPLTTAPCDASSPAWSWRSDGSVAMSGGAGLCLNVDGASAAPNASLILWPCAALGAPAPNAVFAYAAAGARITAVAAALCLSASGAAPPTPVGAKGYLDAVADCGADASGGSDATAALRACFATAYDWRARGWPVPVLLPGGVYLVSDTLALAQENPGPDDGINVVPARFLSFGVFGSSAGGARAVLRLAPASPGFQGAAAAGSSAGGARAVLRLAPASPGFQGAAAAAAPAPAGGAAPYKPVVHIFSSAGEGVDMNNVFVNIDIDLTAPGNAGAAGISHAGAQGASVSDVTVTAAPDTFACFAGLNGAGGAHSNIACTGARYGIYIDNSQPVPVAVGATLINQSISAVYYASQESLSLVGARIVLAPGAAGPAIASVGGNRGMSLVDVSVACADGSPAAAVATPASLYARDLYVTGCALAVAQAGVAPLAGAAARGSWLHVAEYAHGSDFGEFFYSSVIYADGVASRNATVAAAAVLAPPGAPPADLQARHVWDRASFPGADAPGVADARRDCGAAGDDASDDTAALQRCLDAHARVFLPPGRFRISATLRLPAGGALVGMGASFSFLLAASSGGFANASAAAPAPLLQTAADDAGAPVTLAFLGIATWQHLAHVTTLDWRSRDARSLWRSNFESRNCECLWTSAWQALAPTAIPCQQPANLSAAKSLFRGLGRVLSFVNDDTGAILSTAATYRSLRIADTAGVASDAARLRFYSLNLEHSQAEANGELANASFVDIYSIKGEGNMPLLWLREGVANVSVLAMGGGFTPWPSNWTFPSDFTQAPPSVFRVDAGATGVTFALMQDHGIGASSYWPPTGGTCKWERHYPYPGEAVPAYPFSTFPNATQFNCWFGYYVSTLYWAMIRTGPAWADATAPTDKPVLWRLS